MVFSGFNIIQQTPNSLVIEYQIEQLNQSRMQIEGQEFYSLAFRDGILTGEYGKPAVPYVHSRLAVPPGSRVSYQLSVLESETVNDVTVLPQGMEFRRNTDPLIWDKDAYSSSSPYPGGDVLAGDEYNFRGVNVVPLNIYPIQYFPASRQLVIHKSIRITFRFSGGQTLVSPASFSAYEQSILQKKIINAGQAGIFSYRAPVSFKKMAVNYDLSSGEWYRIPVREEGIYQITGSFLKSAGIDINSVQTSGVHIYNYGGYALPYSVSADRPQDLNEIAIEVTDNDQDGVMDENDRILFYGKGLGGWRCETVNGRLRWVYSGNPDGNRTLFPYDDTNYYIFTFNSQPGKKIQQTASPQNPAPRKPSTFTDYYHFESDQYNIMSSGLDWYWLKMTGLSDKKSAVFSLPQNLADDSVSVDVQFHGGSGSIYGDNEYYLYSLRVLINSQVILDNIYFTRNGTVARNFQRPVLTALKSGENTIEVQHTGNLQGCEVYLDFFNVQVKRPFVAENSFLRFRDILGGGVPVEYQVSGLPAGQNSVWDVSDNANVRKILPAQNGQTVVFQDISGQPRGSDYFVYGPAVVKNIGSMERIQNRPNLRDPSRRAEFIIITPEVFNDAAEFLETWRETQIPDRIETERVSVDQIFDEFSSSVHDVTAIRDFLKYAYENWSDTLKYVLLLGDGHYDYRSIRIKDNPDYIPPFEISNSAEVDSRETDNYYVAFGMNGDLNNIDPFLSVARLPVNSPEQLEIFRDKAEKYSTSYTLEPDKNGWQSWLTFVADDEKGPTNQNQELGWHMSPTENIIKTDVPRKFNIDKIYLYEYDPIPGGLGRWKPKATEDLLNRINRGTLMINFFGHGDSDTWAHESVLNRARDLPKFQNAYRLPIWVAATCTWGKYDNPSRPSMSEELIWLRQKGGIGVISASRPVYVNGNTAFTDSFYAALFNSKSDFLASRRIGEAFFLASQGGVNYQKFHLYGDPTLHLADPQNRIEIESVSPDTLKALSTVVVEAKITRQDGTLMGNFEGSAILQVFDAQERRTADDGFTHINYVKNGGTIFKGLVTVSNGHLTGRFIVPKSIKYDVSPTGRLSMYAWSDEIGDAIGYRDSLLLYGSETQVADQDGPDISVFFKNNPNFFDGDFVSNQPTLQAEIDDANGINLTGEVGHKIELTIDESIKKDMTDFFVYDKDSYKKGKVEYTLPAMSSGTHTLKIACWDNLNNYSEREVTFRTSAANNLMLTEVVNYPNPFSDRTQFTFQLMSPGGMADVTIGVYTVTGRKIYEIRDIAQQGFNKLPRDGWDGRDWDGDLIANGVYLYKVTVDDGSKTLEKIEKLAVVR